MPLKIINATEVRPGTNIMVDGVPCTAKNIDMSKTGKHGSMKCRIEVMGIIDGKKRILLKPGHDRFDVPMIEKKRGQVLSISDKTANVMDMETFETLNLDIADEVKEEVLEGVQVEYWDIEGKKFIKSVIKTK